MGFSVIELTCFPLTTLLYEYENILILTYTFNYNKKSDVQDQVTLVTIGYKYIGERE